MTTILKTDTYILVRDLPGERPNKHYLNNKNEALKLAQNYLLMEGTITIYDAEGKMIYRHAQPSRRRNHE